MVMLLFTQYDSSVLPFVFTESQFHATCLQLRSPTKTTASFCEKKWRQDPQERLQMQAGGRWKRTAVDLDSVDGDIQQWLPAPLG
jgi:hypothetical protein